MMKPSTLLRKNYCTIIMALYCVPLDARVCNAIRLSTLMSLIGSFNFSHISFSFRLFVDGKYFFILLCLAFTSILCLVFVPVS